MNIQRFRKLCLCKNIFRSSKFRSAHQLKSEVSEIDFLPKQEAQVSQLESGIKVVSIEDNSPVTQVAVVIKAGSRYENPEKNSGVVHFLRNSAVLSTKHHTSFSLTRSIEVCGAKLSVSSTRDHLFYTLKTPRDYVDSCLGILSDITNNQLFKPWELADISINMQVDLAMLNNNPYAVLNELIHKAAFRGGLSNSLFTPSYMIGKHNGELLQDYIREHFTVSKTSVVALGIEHDHLQSWVNDMFQLTDSSSKNNHGISKFGPGEIRQEEDMSHVHVAIVAEGAGLNTKDALCLSLFQSILDSDSIGKSCSQKYSKLGASAAKSSKSPFFVNSLNINYSDTGLFGVYVTGAPDSMSELIKAVVSEMKQTAKNITESDLKIARHKLKAKLFQDAEISSNVLNNMAIQTADLGQVRNVSDMIKSLDALKVSEVQSVAARVMKAKPAMAALGRLHATPHVDELV